MFRELRNIFLNINVCVRWFSWAKELNWLYGSIFFRQVFENLHFNYLFPLLILSPDGHNGSVFIRVPSALFINIQRKGRKDNIYRLHHRESSMEF